jgi:biotin carboxylase
VKKIQDAIVLFDLASSGEDLKHAARNLGYFVIAVFTQSLQSYLDIYHTSEKELFLHCDEVIVSSNPEHILQRLRASPHPIRAVLAATEGGVELADQVAHALNVWRNPIELSKARRDKGEMRKLLKKSGLSCPDFQLCTTESQVREFANSHPFPLIIKTPKGVMTSQVYQCDTVDNLVDSFHKIYGQKDIYGHSAPYAVLEEYISGQEFIVDTFSDGKKVHVTDVWVYEKTGSEAYKNIHYNAFSLFPYDPASPLIDYSLRIAKLFGIERGPAHIEIKNDPERGPTLIEIGARLSGVHLPEFIKKHSNFDPYESMIRVFVDGHIDHFPLVVIDKHLCIALCSQQKSGKIKRFLGLDAIEKLSSYDFHMFNSRVGDILEPSTHGGTIPLLVFLANRDRQLLLKDVAAAHALFAIELDERPS